VATPAGVVAEVETVSVDDPEAVIDAELNAAVVLAGNPATLRVTAPLNPLIAATETEYVVLLPIETVCEAGEAATVKSGVRTFTLSVTVAL